MKTLNAILIDDEEDSRAVLAALLRKHCPNVNIVAVADNAIEGVKAINEHDPHVVFLDIEMPGENGFSIYKEIKNPRFHTIIVSGYDQYALDAIKHAALDYLLKPVMKDELVKAVNKLDAEAISNDPRTEHLFNLLNDPIGAHEKLVIPSNKTYQVVDYSEIISIQGVQGSYSIIKLADNNKIVASDALNRFEDILPSERFLRVHRAHLISLSHIKKFDRMERLVHMKNGDEFTVSTRKTSALLKALRETE